MLGDGDSHHRDSLQPSQSQSQSSHPSQSSALLQTQPQPQQPQSQCQSQDAPAVEPAASAAVSAVLPAGAPRSSPSRALQQGRPSSTAVPSSSAPRAGPTVTIDTNTDQLSSHASSVNNKLQKKPRAVSSSAAASKKPQDLPKDPKDTQHKKKRRFFGLGGSSDSSSSSSAVAPQQQQTSPTSAGKGGFFARSLSTRNRPLSYQGAQVSRTPSADKETWLSSASHLRPDPIAEESLPPTSRSSPSNRHSIAGLPLAADIDSKAPQQDLPSPNISPVLPPAAFKTFHSQSSDADEVGSKPSSAWSERSKAPAAQHYTTYNTQFLNINDDSRPSSRHSLEPSSPLQPQGQYIAYHPHKAVSQSSVNKLDISRDPSPLHQQPPLQRLPSAQSTATGGTYGSSLDPDSASRKQHKQLGMVQNNSAEGRATPPPSKSKEDLASLDFPQLLGKHEELNDKYRKVKKYYFEKDAQVQQLQNQLAHQRLAQSRTSLDDNEYSNRFQRLDGAINNLAFNVRKDWKAVPPWLSPFVNNDATTKVTKEMTAVGRACISRWLVDEIFDRIFHPALEPGLSSNLKIIERNLRRFSPPVNSDEERDALLTKISNWRLATLDGLVEALNSPQATEYRTDLTRGLVETLTSDLQMNLTTPPPAGLEAGVIGIIELAVGIAANLPLESRDVYVEYILPGIPFNDAFMKLEGTLPPLVNPGETYGTDADAHQHLQQQRRGSADEPMGEGPDGPPIGGFLGAGPKDKKGNGHGGKKGEEEKKDFERVRFAGFMSVMVKGKSMLVKAPVFV